MVRLLILHIHNIYNIFKMTLYGKNSLYDCVRNKVSIINVLLAEQKPEIINFLIKNNVKYKIDKLSFKSLQSINHQGIIVISKDNCINDFDQWIKISKDKSLVVIVDEIEDPGNFGSIIRTCEALGVDAIIYKKNNQVQINDYVIKTSMGAINNINLLKVANLANTIDILKNNKYWIYSTSLDKKSVDYKTVKYDDKSVIIFGNEKSGISKLLLDKSDFLINIPMIGKVQSLNVSVSVGIILANIVNQ